MRIVVSLLVGAIIAGCSGAPGSTPLGNSPSAADGTSARTLTASPTATSAAASTPAASPVSPGITAWTNYTSAAYGIAFGYPDGWTLEGAATR